MTNALVYPCHPRDIRTLRGGAASHYTVPVGRIFVLTMIGSELGTGVSPAGLISPPTELYANGLLVLRGGKLGYMMYDNGVLTPTPSLALKEYYGPMVAWSTVPKGLHFPAGTVLQVKQELQGWPAPWNFTGRAAGYLVND